MSESAVIRHAQRSDIAALLSMMTALAKFEGYAEKFRVTATELADQPLGMLVYYHLPFSYDLKPWVYMMELFVYEPMRSAGIGKKLMQHFINDCRSR
jgi:N-acetylglutamate synthase-like GNAT family acetyltransferase